MKICLEPTLVDDLVPPAKGEVWIGDTHVEGFGIRAWAGKGGGNKVFAIRLRDKSGLVVRETFRPELHSLLYHWHEGWRKPLGSFLADARRWAEDRRASHLGLATRADIEAARRRRRKARVLATSLDAAVEQRFSRLRQKSTELVYVDQMQDLIDKYVAPTLLARTFQDVPIRDLADAITDKSIGYGNIKVLRAFVGGLFKEAADDFAPLGRKLKSLQRRCRTNLGARKEPPFPAILQISEDDYHRFFAYLEADAHWRQTLAIRLYFATGAKLQQVLKARWSDIVDQSWYPFTPTDRKLWYESHERLSEEAQAVLSLLVGKHAEEGLRSLYLFPSTGDVSRPITTVQRHWRRISGVFGWVNLPMSHVVLRHNPRTNPSHSLVFFRAYLNFDKARKGMPAVSKIAKLRRNKRVDSVAYWMGSKSS